MQEILNRKPSIRILLYKNCDTAFINVYIVKILKASDKPFCICKNHWRWQNFKCGMSVTISNLTYNSYGIIFKRINVNFNRDLPNSKSKPFKILSHLTSLFSYLSIQIPPSKPSHYETRIVCKLKHIDCLAHHQPSTPPAYRDSYDLLVEWVVA